jgi:hypothetical protein
MNWTEAFLQYAVKIGRMYKDNPEQVLDSLRFDSVLESLNETYQCLVKENEIPRLEDLATDHKEFLWIKSKQYSDEQAKRIRICKAIYLLDMLDR